MKRPLLHIDRPLLLSTLLLLALGLVMVFSASAGMSEQLYGSAYLFLRKQIIWDLLAIATIIVCMRIDYHKWQRVAAPMLLFAIVLLIAVLKFGPVIKGAQRWLSVGFVNIQPSEVAKLATLVWLSDFLDRHRSQLGDFKKGFLPAVAVLGIVCVLILKEPDLGTPILLGTTGMILIYLAGGRTLHMVSLIALSMIPLYYELFHVSYRARRLMAFLNPNADPSGAGYQLMQSLLAFGSGGLLGKGLGASQLKLLYLPDPHTDFIFPVIGEELGFIGALGVVLIFVFWGLRGWQVAKRAPDLFGQLLAAGITCWVLFQAAINMGVSCGLLPTKGLPLPFVSFGGSSLVITVAAAGILLNISSQTHARKVAAQSPPRTKRRR